MPCSTDGSGRIDPTCAYAPTGRIDPPLARNNQVLHSLAANPPTHPRTHRHAKGDERGELDELKEDGELVEEVEGRDARGLGEAGEGGGAGPGE